MEKDSKGDEDTVVREEINVATGVGECNAVFTVQKTYKDPGDEELSV